ncbi:hypothetical protein RBB50_005680 [Rhinocladiella similis]
MSESTLAPVADALEHTSARSGANGGSVYHNGVNGHHNGELKSESIDIPLRQANAWAPRKKLRIITVGAGFSGLLFAHKLQHQYPEMQDLVTHTIYEARDKIGGTWYVNTYPGVQCDVPSHIYAFPFDPNPNWSHFYSTGKEIHEYILSTTKKWNLDRDVKLNHRVLEAVWQEDIGQWKCTIQHGDRQWVEHTDILISGQGILNKWRWPDIEGLHSFKGHKCHSANWDNNYDYSNKTIGVIGNGSSGIQIVPSLAKLPGTNVVSFQRSPTYIYYRMAPSKLLNRDDISGNPVYTEEDKRRFREDPAHLRQYRKTIVHKINNAFKMFIKDTPANKEVSDDARRQMADKLNHDPELCAKLIPSWELGCRRITPGEGYLEAFLKPNVRLVQQGVVRVTEDSIIAADGSGHKVDVIACATGFDVSFTPQWRMIGRNGVDLAKEWSVDPESYLSICARDMPNYFMFMGPNSVIAHGSLMESLNWTGDYLIKWLKKMCTEDIKYIVPKSKVVDELITYGDKIHKTLVWSGGCKSWYKRNTVDGRVTAAFAGSAILYKNLISELRPEDFEVEYTSPNRWFFLGNGFTEYEMDPDSDLSWYIER